MTSAPWKTIESLFYEALAKQGEERQRFLDSVRERDSALYYEVQSLLFYHNPTDSLDKAAAGVASVIESATLWNKGEQIGPYEIAGFLGRGGMGEIYLAHDNHLGRKVVLKTLPSDLAHEVSLVDRLKREAQTASSLNHPNIVTIFDFDQYDETNFVVTEFVEGSNLRSLIGTIPLAHALNYARQIGQALEVAHAVGIVHRDIKPENIMVRPDGLIKVLDFGLAKFLRPLPGANQSLYEQISVNGIDTIPGALAGTIRYMSPEQIRGQAVDFNTDIWSWGVVFYEMLTGKLPFDSPMPIDALAAILTKDPVLPAVDKTLKQLLAKSLAKSPTERYRTMADALKDLDDADSLKKKPSSLSTRIYSKMSAIFERVGLAGKVIGVAAALVLLLTSWFVIYRPHAPIPYKPIRINSMMRITATGNITRTAISPDGSYLAYATEDGVEQVLRIRQLKTSTDREIVPAGVGSYLGITFSKDGHFIYYVFQKNQQGGLIGTLFSIPILGGTPKKILDDVDSPVSFSPDGSRYVFLRRNPKNGQYEMLVHDSSESGEKTIATVNAPQTFGPAPVWSPNGKSIACGIRMGFTPGAANVKIIVISIADGHQQVIGPLPWYWMGKPAWGTDGEHIALAASNILANHSQLVEVSLSDGAVSMIAPDTQNYGDLDSAADLTTFAAVQSNRVSTIWIVPVRGKTLRPITKPGARFYGITWTRGGKLISQSDIGGQPDLWSIDAENGDLRQVTDDQYVEELPVSSPDGKYLIYSSNRDGAFHLWRSNADGTDPIRLTSDVSHEDNADVTPDGRWVVYTSSKSGYLSLWKVPIDGGEPHQLVQQESKESVVSPKGDLIACKYYDPTQGWQTVILQADTGQFVRSFKNIIESPVRWSKDGKYIFYIKTENGISNIWAQPVSGGDSTKMTYFTEGRIFAFAVSPNGKQLACVRGARTSDAILFDLE